MDVKDLPIYSDIKKIVEKPIDENRLYLEITVHTTEDDINIKLFESLDILSDYGNNYGNEMEISFKMGLGDYQRFIYPYRHNLEITIKYAPFDKDKQMYVNRYKLIIVNQDNVLDGSSLDLIDKDDLNVMSIILLKGKLLDRELEIFRTLSTSGTYRNTTQKDLLLGLISNGNEKITIDGQSILDSIDIYKPDNEKQYNHLIIPDGTELVNLANYLQKKAYGIYAGDIGLFLDIYRGMYTCFIYPLFNYDRYDKSNSKLTIYGVPNGIYDLIENTWYIDGDNLEIITGENTKIINDGEAQLMSTGNGFRMPESEAMLRKPIEIDESGPIANRRKLAYEVAINDREDQINYSPTKRSSNNPFLQYGEILRKNGILTHMTWRYSNHELIYPGMPVMYVFMKKDVIVKLRGIVHQTHTVIGIDNISITLISMYLERKNFNTI